MKKILLIVTILTIIYSQSDAQYRKFSSPIWTIGTAKTISKKELDLNLLYYSQYGITNRVELQMKPLWWYKFPNLGLKITWWNKKSEPNANFFKKLGIIVGTKHGIYYPTPLMNYIQDKSFQNIDFGSSPIPPIFAIKNELLITFIINKFKGCYQNRGILTLKAGNQKAFKNQNQNFVLTDKAILFRQTTIFGDYSLWYFGIDYDSKLSYGLNYKIDVDFYSVGLLIHNWIFEHKGLVYWYMGANKKIRTTIGYKFSYANYPGTKLSLYPLFDLTYMIHFRKKGKSNDLFDNGVLEDPFDDRDAIH
ncbi:MAG: hypothetical protein JXL97_13155 [Bacteroidales bacterium]|nr:hypothetical protein [Bacteroidales bacterium]